MRTVTPEEAVAVERGHDGNRYTMVDYLGSHSAREPGEQAYLVRQESPELRAHFHEVDQFQVVTAGSGTLGPDEAASGVLHYTDAYTSYGPIRTDPAVGLSYFTLRRDPTTGINYMPEEREKRRREAGRGEHFTVVLDERVAAGAGPVELARTDRGAAAYGVRLAGGEALSPVGLARGQAGYLVVLDGVLEAGSPGAGRSLPAESLLSFDDAADLPVLTADGRAVVAVLLFAPAAPVS